MNWLSFFKTKKRITPLPKRAEAATYIRTLFTTSTWDRMTHLVRTPGKDLPEMIEAHWVDFAAGCVDSLTWSEHLALCANRWGIRITELGSDLMDPRPLVERGLICTPQDLAAQIRSLAKEPTPSPPPLHRTGLVTYRRPEALSHTLATYREHLEKHGRSMECLVVDEARDFSDQGATRHVVGREKTKSFDCHWIQQEGFTRLRDDLVRATGCDPALVGWALGTGERHFLSAGTAENILTLMQAGEAFLHLDDDFDIHPHDLAPDPGHLVVAGSWIPYQYRFGIDLGRAVETDYVAAHEKMLGRPLDELLHPETGYDHVEFARLNQESLERLRHPGATVRLTLAGYYGDPGALPGRLYHHLDSAAMPGFWGNEDTRRAALDSRFLHRCAPAAAITPPRMVIGGAAGIDNRCLLPPQIPDCRGKDAFFADCIWMFRPESWIGHIPLSIGHFPSDTRPHPHFWKETDTARPWLCHPVELIKAATLLALASVPATDPAKRMERAGMFLEKFAEEDGGLEAAMEDWLEQSFSRQLVVMEGFLQAGPSPGHKADLESYLRCLEAALREPRTFMPGIHGAEAGTRDAWVRMRALISRMGLLLQVWPALWQVAASWGHEERLARYTGGPE
jgi:hypothetical protein